MEWVLALLLGVAFLGAHLRLSLLLKDTPRYQGGRLSQENWKALYDSPEQDRYHRKSTGEPSSHVSTRDAAVVKGGPSSS